MFTNTGGTLPITSVKSNAESFEDSKYQDYLLEIVQQLNLMHFLLIPVIQIVLMKGYITLQFQLLNLLSIF